MQVFRVTGGARLVGEVPVVGAKNSVLKLMAAALLAEGSTTITNLPAIADVDIMNQLLQRLGCRTTATEDGLGGEGVVIDVPERPSPDAPYELVRKIRASICVLGPLLARTGRAKVALPGGDNIGSRKLDMHFAGLERMGATLGIEHGFVVAEAGTLTGATIWLDFPSVGATENLLMAAVLAKGTTAIDNAAREPEIVDLCQMLVAMGAQIEGIGTSTLEIEGVDALAPGAPRGGGRPDRGRHVGDGGDDDPGRHHGGRRQRATSGDRARQARHRRRPDRRRGQWLPGTDARTAAFLRRRRRCPTPASRPTCSRKPSRCCRWPPARR